MNFLKISSSALYGLFNKMDSTSQNIANSSTDGYLKEILNFSVENEEVKIFKYIDTSKGMLIKTDSDYDIALKDDSFFCVTDGEKHLYTRKGSLYIDNEGYLRNTDGFYFTNKNGEKIKLEKNKNFTIEENGDIIQESKKIDTLKTVIIENKENLISYGKGVFYSKETPKNTEPKIIRKHLESSNVNPIDEMSNLIKITRTTELLQKGINSEIELTKKLLSTSSKF